MLMFWKSLYIKVKKGTDMELLKSEHQFYGCVLLNIFETNVLTLIYI